MPRLRKVIIHKTVLFVTTSVEEGLMFPANSVVKAILKSAIARAQNLHPVVVSHFLFEATHAHFVLVVDNPDDVKGFIERFKTESAHAVNRLLGRKKRTVWCRGYDSPVLLTVEDVLEKIVYLYINPAKDNLEESIKEYPGLSSWEMFSKGRHTHKWAWVHRPGIPCLSGKTLSAEGYNQLAGEMIAGAWGKRQEFRVEPDAWMKCFEIEDSDERARLNKLIVEQVKAREDSYRKRRIKQGKGVIGRNRLVAQGLDIRYRPEREGRQTWCICCDKQRRKEFIDWVKRLIEQAYDVYVRWRVGDYTLPYPLGLYAPSLPKLAEPVGVW
ncbi:MAG: hypothetical protein GX589_10900 [Deltaproteobacteria bacterium]|nr:hypothetical protein [Deltaproteobacteria bacterium]